MKTENIYYQRERYSYQRPQNTREPQIALNPGRKDELTRKFDKALKEHNMIKTELQSYKISTSEEEQSFPFSLPKPLKADRSSPINPLPQKSQSVQQAPDSIQTFNNVLEKAEMILSRNRSNYPKFKLSTSSYNKEEESKYDPNVKDKNAIMNNIILILKTQNKILNMSNMDLRNVNKILKIELDSYKKRLSKSPSPLLQYDPQSEYFCDLLKNGLDTSKISKKEMNDILKYTQEQNEKLIEEKANLVQQIEHYSKEHDISYTKNQEVQNETTDILSRYNDLIKDNNDIKNQISFLKDKINEQKIKNYEMQKVISDFESEENQNQLAINTIKQSIEELREQNDEKNKNLYESKSNFEIGNGEAYSYDIKRNQMNQEMQQLSNRLDTLNEKREMLINESKAKIDDINSLQLQIKKMQLEFAQVKDNSLAMKKCIEDRNNTIQSQKESYNAFNESLNERGYQFKGSEQQKQIEEKRKMLIEYLFKVNDKAQEYEDVKDNYKEEIKQKSEKVNELNMQKFE